MAHEKLKPNFVFDEEKIEKLKQLAPECFEDGKINFETLKQNLGHWSDEEDESLEHFGLFWPGKKLARRAATLPPEGTLEPVFGDGLKPDGSSDEDGINPSKNIFIEGENLEVLKLLQKSYADKIKMIYIDPPYNTGNDFVYDDDFTEPLQEYLRRTGQIDEEGKSLTTNKRSDGRFHSKWLSMMYPRLRLARNLLKDDGMIFVSIDDNEVHNLRALLNEIFGEENFVSQLVWEKKKKGTFLSNTITNVKEYILVYSKNITSFTGLIGEINSSEETYPCINASNKRQIITIPKGILSNYKELNHVLEKGNEISVETMSLLLHSDLVIKDGILAEDLIIEGNWRYNPDLMREFAEKKEIYLTRDLYLRRIVKEPRVKTLKDLLTRVGDEQESDFRDFDINNLFADGWGSNEDGVEEIRQLFEKERLMDYPKPVKLVSKLISSIRDENAVVLDFFAGSGTTAQAVMNVNAKDNGKRTFIMVQIPEMPSEGSVARSAGYHSIATLSKDRIIKAIQKNVNFVGVSFQYLKLTTSNFKKWSDYKGQDVEQLTAQFEEEANSPFASDWNKNKLFTEILLLEGFPLDAQVEEINIGENTIKKVTSDLVSNQLLICLDEQISTLLITDLKIDHNSSFICLDCAISNQDKLRLSDKGLIKTI
jgi:adenine-specific DNA-methyltransferase